jgi:opacity protein-like surface antigen
MRLRLPVFVSMALLFVPSLAAAQFGIGGRMSMIRGDVDTETSAERFTGGHIRARTSPRTALEVSLDLRTEKNDDETERFRQYPIQASLLLFPLNTTFAPYALGGAGWYSTRLDARATEDDDWEEVETARKFGWHAGFGAELRMGRHAGIHADYRYTFLKFDDDDEEEGVVSRLLPSYKGSMWTAGLTIYF